MRHVTPVTPYLTEASTEIDNVKNDLADIGLPADSGHENRNAEA